MNILAQQGSSASGGDATGAGGEFGYSIGQTDYRYYFSSQGSLQFGLQHGWPETSEPLQCANGITDNHVYSYESLCYNAVETLSIGGDGKQFILESGGHADLIAGKSIILKDGTTIKPGGSLHAWITTDGSYCNDTISARVPCNLETPSQVITSTEALCFSAIETVVFAGNGKLFVVEPGAQVEIIAGQSVLFKDGTTIKPGSNLHAWITTDNNFCTDTNPNNLDIPDLVVVENEALCFDAIETVNVAGDGKSFVVEAGAHVDIIAGHSIHFKDGTTIKSGSSLHAWITTDGTYCSEPKNLLAADIEEEKMLLKPLEPDSNASFFNVYPNPTTGEFTLELLDYNEFSTIIVEIYTIQGLIINSTQLPSGKLFNFSLAERPSGIYLIRVLKNKDVNIGKIIKR